MGGDDSPGQEGVSDKPAAVAGPPERVTRYAVVMVFLPFAGGYYLSYLYRVVGAIIADRLQADIGLGAAELGLLTSAYFISFAAFQLPLGLLLDRFGPRRVHGTLMLLTAAGAALFALGDSLLTLWLARALIGLGVSGGLMAALKAITQWFPERRWPLVNGLFLATGGLGAMSATVPVEALLGITDWRGVFFGLAGVSLLVALAVLLVVPEPRATRPPPRLRTQVAGLAAIFTDRFFWRLAPVAFLCMATSLSIQGLWAGPWLRDVAGLPREAVAGVLFAMTGAMTVGFVFWGALADRLERLGVPATRTLGGGVGLFLVGLVVITLRLDTGIWSWIAFGLIGNVAALAYTILSRHVPRSFAGRTNTALNVLVFVGAFAIQAAMGWIIDLWPLGPADRAPPAAYTAAFGVFAALCALAWVWYLAAARRAPLGRTALKEDG